MGACHAQVNMCQKGFNNYIHDNLFIIIEITITKYSIQMLDSPIGMNVFDARVNLIPLGEGWGRGVKILVRVEKNIFL